MLQSRCPKAPRQDPGHLWRCGANRLRAYVPLFDAIYCCSPQLESLVQSLSALGLNEDDASLVSRLADWVLNVAPCGPLPMSPSDAVALA